MKTIITSSAPALSQCGASEHLSKFCLAIADYGSRGYEGIISDPFEKSTIDRIVDDIVSEHVSSQ